MFNYTEAGFLTRRSAGRLESDATHDRAPADRARRVAFRQVIGALMVLVIVVWLTTTIVGYGLIDDGLKSGCGPKLCPGVQVRHRSVHLRPALSTSTLPFP